MLSKIHFFGDLYWAIRINSLAHDDREINVKRASLSYRENQ